MTLRFAVIGIDHRHVYELTQYLIDAGLDCAGWWNVTTRSRSVRRGRLLATSPREAAV